MSRDPRLERIRLKSYRVYTLLDSAEALKLYARNHRRQTNEHMMRELGIPAHRFYRVLAISRWSNKVKKLIREHGATLSPTALFWFASRKWKDARQLFHAMRAKVMRLAQRKKKARQEGRKPMDHIAAFLQKRHEPRPPVKVVSFEYQWKFQVFRYNLTTQRQQYDEMVGWLNRMGIPHGVGDA